MLSEAGGVAVAACLVVGGKGLGVRGSGSGFGFAFGFGFRV